MSPIQLAPAACRRIHVVSFDVPAGPRCSRRAFTLIELLVVVSIIAILISMLIPMISTIREMANSLVCQNNLRQIAIATNVYAEEYSGILPGAPANRFPNGNFVFWPRALAPYLGTTWEWDVPNTWNDTSSQVKIYNCPTNSYAKNAQIGIHKPWPVHYISHQNNLSDLYNEPGNPIWRSIVSIPNPQYAWMFIDLNTSGSNWGIEVSNGGSWDTGLVTRDPDSLQPSFRHRGLANLVMVDGHFASYFSPASSQPAERRWQFNLVY